MQDKFDLCAEMGISYDDAKDLEEKEFHYYYTGLQRRLQRNWDYSRHIIANVRNSSGFSKKTWKPTDIFKLSYIDGYQPKLEKMSDDRIKQLMNKWQTS